MRLHYLLIPLFTVMVSVVGSSFTSAGMVWYRTIKLPSYTPPGGVIGAVWTTIFILATISAILVWNTATHNNAFYWVMGVFVVNGILNVLWSFLFFKMHWMGTAIFESGLLGLSVILLMVLIWPISQFATWLLTPYAAWVSFATYLTYSIYSLNK